ncbi:uncharacterized protein BCR38DRAFT_308873, partial [Pseudomassariella vexata]
MVKPAGDGVQLLYTSIVMMSLSWVMVISRVAVRRWIKAFGVDDWLMISGLMIYSVTCSLCIVCSYYGAGQYRKDLSASDVMQGTKLFFIAEFFYASCTVPIKSSICVTLLRIADPRRRFVWTIWSIIIATTATSVIFIVAIANICHPITTLWGETTTGTCNPIINSTVSFLFSAVSILTDWSLAILPAVLLWNIQMKPKVKISVAVILGLAAFASCATIVRLRYLTLYNNQAEFLLSTGKIGLWSIIEEGIGIIAGSIPALRPLLNLPLFGRSTVGSGSHGRLDDGSGAFRSAPSQNIINDRRHQHSVKMETYLTAAGENGGNRHRGSEDADSEKHILKETQVSVTAEQS